MSFSLAKRGLQRFVNQAARDVIDPQAGVSVLDRLRGRIRANAYAGTGREVSALSLQAAKAGGDMPISPLGSGSDYAAFIHHLGIASVNVGFGGEGAGDGSYHSAYDSFQHVTRFDDPGLAYGAALSKLVGRMVIRAATAPRSLARYGDLASAVHRYAGEVKKLSADQRDSDRALRDLTREDVFRYASSPTDPIKPPAMPEGIAPLIDMLAPEDAADRLTRSAAAADAALERFPKLPVATQTHIAVLLRDIDQLLLHRDGLPGRPWYRNLISAPGTLTGYGAKTLPGIREAIEQRRFDDARSYVEKTAAVLNAYSARLDEATRSANGTGGKPPGQ